MKRTLITILVAGAALAALPATAPAGTSIDASTSAIHTNYGRYCALGLQGAALGTVNLALRDIATYTQTYCSLGSSGQPPEYVDTTSSLYWHYTPDVQGFWVGEREANGACWVYNAQFCDVYRVNRLVNHPGARYTTEGTYYILLPTSASEEFTDYSVGPHHTCTGFYRLHQNLEGWHLSGLSCVGAADFNAPLV
jgi:hypothetical protein